MNAVMSQETYDALKAELDPPPAPPADEPNKFEVRGYELAKLRPDGSWEVVGKYRDSEFGLGAANTACAALSRNWPKTTYAVRVLVSCELPKVPVEPLVLEADEPSPPTEAVEEAMKDLGLSTPSYISDSAAQFMFDGD